jgi:hypothetical protein
MARTRAGENPVGSWKRDSSARSGKTPVNGRAADADPGSDGGDEALVSTREETRTITFTVVPTGFYVPGGLPPGR